MIARAGHPLHRHLLDLSCTETGLSTLNSKSRTMNPPTEEANVTDDYHKDEAAISKLTPSQFT